MPAAKRWLTYGNRSRQMLLRRAALAGGKAVELLRMINVIVQIEHLKSHRPSRGGSGAQTRAAWLGYRIHDGEILQLHRHRRFPAWP